MPKKKRRRRELTPAYYNVEITGWDWDYSFSANVPKYEDARFSDYRHLLVRGTVLRPRGIKAEVAELWFFPRIEPEDFKTGRDQPPPRGVGSLEIQGSSPDRRKLVGYLSMPKDALEPVLQMLLAARFKYVLMDGEPMRWRKCIIRRFEFAAEHDETEYPDDD